MPFNGMTCLFTWIDLALFFPLDLCEIESLSSVIGSVRRTGTSIHPLVEKHVSVQKTK